MLPLPAVSIRVLTLLCLVPGVSSGYFYDNGSEPPNPENVLPIDPGAGPWTVIVRDEGCPNQPPWTEPCESEGSPTGVATTDDFWGYSVRVFDHSWFSLEGGLAHRAEAYHESILRVSAGTLGMPRAYEGAFPLVYLYDSSRIDVMGGEIGGKVWLHDSSRFEMSNGVALETIWGADTSHILLSDDAVADEIVLRDGAHFRMTGGAYALRLSAENIEGETSLEGGEFLWDVSVRGPSMTMADTWMRSLFATDGAQVEAWSFIARTGVNVWDRESLVELNGGSVYSELDVRGGATVHMRGGVVVSEDWDGVDDLDLAGGNLRLYGADFAIDGEPVGFGPVAVQSGRLTGILQHGEPIDNRFSLAGGGHLTLIEAEPQITVLDDSGTHVWDTKLLDRESVELDGQTALELRGEGGARYVELLDESLLQLDGGTVETHVEARDRSEVTMTEGELRAEARFYDDARFTMSGGRIAFNLLGEGRSQIEISGGQVGDRFELSDASSLRLTGPVEKAPPDSLFSTYRSVQAFLNDRARFSLEDEATQIDSIYAYDRARVELHDGVANFLNLRNSAQGTVRDGAHGLIELYDDASIEISGGTIRLLRSFRTWEDRGVLDYGRKWEGSDIDDPDIVISGGTIESGIRADRYDLFLHGGTVQEDVRLLHESVGHMTGGDIEKSLRVDWASHMRIEGGSIGNRLEVAHSSVVEIAGSDFFLDGNAVPYGELTMDGRLAGTTPGGVIDFLVVREHDRVNSRQEYRGKGIVRLVRPEDESSFLVPEPNARALQLAALAAIVALRRGLACRSRIA